MENRTAAQLIEAAYQVGEGESVCVVRPGKKGWQQYEWNAQTARMVEDQPDEWYVCVSTVQTPAAKERIKRRKRDCQAVWVLMLDDIGTKAAEPSMPPSAILETSAGNYQYLYFLHGVELESADAIARFEAQHRAVCTAGFGDPGSGGVSRVYRLPGSINRKPGKNNWQTRVVRWEPERVFFIDELLEHIGVKVDYEAAAEITIPIVPEDMDDPVLEWLDNTNRLGSETGEWYAIVCPWAHTHTSPGEAAGYSPLGHGDKPHLRGFHCFHGHCAGRTVTDFLSWVQTQGGPAVSMVGVREMDALALRSVARQLTTQERMELLRNTLPQLSKANLPDTRLGAKGLPLDVQLPTRSNVEYVVNTYGAIVRRNLMSHEIVASFKDQEMQALVRIDEEAMRVLFDGCLRAGISNQKNVGDIICEIATVHDYHPMEDWIRAQTWDGKSRLATLAHTVSVDPDYENVWKLYLRRWLIQTVQAVCGWRRPKMIGGVIVLVGEQYIGKSSWLGALVPPQFFLGAQDLRLHGYSHVDTIMRATGRSIVELGELDATFRQSDVAAIKAFLTQTEDRYRSPYGTKPLDWPRTTSFCATVNKVDFLVDSTGNRRYWPVIVRDCNPAHGMDLGQIWAEIYQLWKAGEQWWLTREEEAIRREGGEFFYAISDVEQDAVQWLDDHSDAKTEPMTQTMFCKRLGHPTSRVNLSSLRRILSIRLGKPRMIRGIRNSWAVPTQIKRGHLEAVKDSFPAEWPGEVEK